MFGTYRTLLALWVAAFHLADVPPMGAYAVFGFYILSGYLMTLIMHQNYGYTTTGILKYGVNRFLRVFPIYWASIALSALLIFNVGNGVANTYNDSMYLPSTIPDLFRNIFLFFPLREDPRLTPPAWALTVELFYYILIGLGLSRHKSLVITWFGISAAYHLLVTSLGLGWDYKYFYIPAASLPFATGALIYHHRDAIGTYILRHEEHFTRHLPVILLGLIVSNVLIGINLSIERSGSFYINFFLNALMISILIHYKEIPWIPKSLDKILGDLSYPIYLVHYQAGLITIACAGYFGLSLHRPDFDLFIASLPIILGLSYMFTRGIEQPIERLRKRIKNCI